MSAWMSTHVGRLRAVSAAEGLSYVLLVGVAMPLKYLLDIPAAVRVVGMAHGVLFIAFVVSLVLAWREARWRPGLPVGVFLLSMIPLGAVGIEAWLRADARRRLS